MKKPYSFLNHAVFAICRTTKLAQNITFFRVALSSPARPLHPMTLAHRPESVQAELHGLDLSEVKHVVS